MAANDPAKEDIYIDKDGNRVAENDPAAAFQIAHKGVAMDPKIAARYKDAFAAAAPKPYAKPAVKSDSDARESKGAKKSASSDK